MLNDFLKGFKETKDDIIKKYLKGYISKEEFITRMRKYDKQSGK
jgi:hypothetical protein